jgi:hypothetical protein
LPKGLGGNIASRKAGQRFSRKQSQRRLVDRNPLRLEHKARVQRAIARSNRGGSTSASSRQNASASPSESSPISRAAISAFRRLRFLIA